VDPVALDLPDYWEVVKRPMDLGTIGDKLSSGQYAKVSQFLDDLELVWSNCLLYNPPEDPISEWAVLLRKATQRLAKQVGVVDGEGEPQANGEKKGRFTTLDEKASPVRRAREGGERGRRIDEDEDEDSSYPDTPGRRRSSARLSAKSGKRYYGEEGEEEEEEDEKEGGESRRLRKPSSRRASNGDTQHDNGGDQDEDGSDDEGASEPEAGPAGPIVDKILAHRVVTRPLREEGSVDQAKKDADAAMPLERSKEEGEEENEEAEASAEKARPDPTEEVTEYLVKWKEQSYLHCEWVTADVIEREGTVGRGKINRYHKKKQEAALDAVAVPKGAEMEEEEPPFPPAYCEIDRIIAFEETIEQISPQDAPAAAAPRSDQSARPHTAAALVKKEAEVPPPVPTQPAISAPHSGAHAPERGGPSAASPSSSTSVLTNGPKLPSPGAYSPGLQAAAPPQVRSTIPPASFPFFGDGLGAELAGFSTSTRSEHSALPLCRRPLCNRCRLRRADWLRPMPPTAQCTRRIIQPVSRSQQEQQVATYYLWRLLFILIKCATHL
jgi:hypothetical protein